LKNIFSLKKKVIYVLGGSGLIGKEIVDGASQLGAKIVIIDIEDRLKFKNKDLNSLKFEKLDISNIKNLTKNFDKIIKNNGIPNSFINCSYPKSKDWNKNSYKHVKIESFRKNIDLHLNTYIWIAKIIADKMIKNKSGSIIQLSSIYGNLGQDPTLYEGTKMSESMTYTAIKGGIINSVKSMAAYYGKYNIRINALSPGGVFDNQNPKFVKRYLKKTPLNRMAKPKDIAAAAIFLSSDASTYITGTNFLVDGGWSCI
tara:strand:+ start:61 stop:831 length:771 start_codon:yes stop_codon:yes gene_type:complete